MFPERYLSCHYPPSLSDQTTPSTRAAPVRAHPLMTKQPAEAGGDESTDISLIVVLRFILFLFPRAIAVIPKLLKERVIIMPLTKMKSGTGSVYLTTRPWFLHLAHIGALSDVLPSSVISRKSENTDMKSNMIMRRSVRSLLCFKLSVQLLRRQAE